MKTIDNCRVIKLAMKEMIGTPDIYNGTCQGYAVSEIDDEPCDKCKRCKYLTINNNI